MPTYFFTVQHGDTIAEDKTGIAIQSDQEALSHARTLVRGALDNIATSGDQEWRLDVQNFRFEPLFTLRFFIEYH